MDILKNLIKGRRSCRDFSDETISGERVESLINDAVWVPSGSNNQPWRFAVVTDKSMMKRYSDAAKEHWLRNLDKNPHMRQYVEYMKDPTYNIFYNAPVLIIIYGNRESYWHVYDCSMVAYNLHLLAEESGLGCCWIGFAHNIFGEPETMKELGIPKNYELVAPVILGFPAGPRTSAENPNKRKPFEVSYF
ncbi:MAG TPA: nitroreductase [Geobacteraceae bacterium]|nr:nitroreductase [Geobacteraceae bacterium]